MKSSSSRSIWLLAAVVVTAAFSEVRAEQTVETAKLQATGTVRKGVKASDPESRSAPAVSHAATQPSATASTGREAPVSAAAAKTTLPSSPASAASAASRDLDAFGSSPATAQLEPNPKESNDAVIAKWTIVLGYATGLSAFVALLQLLLLVRGARDTESAAKASQLSARVAELALTKLERPYVLVTVRKAGLAYRDSGGTKNVEPGIQELNLVNFGRSPALLTEFMHDFFVTVKPREKPTLRALSAANHTIFPYGTFSAMGDPHGEKRQLDVGIYGSSLALGTFEAWVVGHVSYRDLLGNEYVTGFAFKFDIRRGEFVRAGEDEFNYGRETKSVTGNASDPTPTRWWQFRWLAGNRVPAR